MHGCYPRLRNALHNLGAVEITTEAYPKDFLLIGDPGSGKLYKPSKQSGTFQSLSNVSQMGKGAQ